jgi:hypothetical protein
MRSSVAAPIPGDPGARFVAIAMARRAPPLEVKDRAGRGGRTHQAGDSERRAFPSRTTPSS